METYTVYVKLNDQNKIAGINSSAFLKDVTGWTAIDRGYGDKYRHAQNHYFNKTIIDDRGVYRYEFVDGVVIERTQKEMDADYVEPEYKRVKSNEELEAENKLLKAQMTALSAQLEFQEECLVEMAGILYA